MLQTLLNGIFWLVTKLAEVIVLPFIAGITALFPATGTMINYITSYISQALKYITAVRQFVGIPVGIITMLFDYYAIKYSIYLLKLGINFAVNIYNKFKP